MFIASYQQSVLKNTAKQVLSKDIYFMFFCFYFYFASADPAHMLLQLKNMPSISNRMYADQNQISFPWNKEKKTNINQIQKRP